MTKLRFDYTDGNGIDNDIPIPRRRSGNGSNNGIRDKWKVSRAVVGQRIRRAGGCNNSHFHYDNDSDVDLVDIDLRTPPTTPNAKSAAAAAAKNKKNAAAAARTMSMLTPDMLETLGLTEVVVKKRECKYESDYDHEYEYEYTHVSAVQVTTATSATATTNRCTPKKKKSVRIDENRNTTIQQSFPETPPQHREALQHDSSSSYRKNKNKRSRQLNRSSNTYDGDNDASPGSPSGSSLSSSSESSSDNSYEPIPRAPDDWTIEDLTADDDDDDNTILHYYRSAAGRDCDVFSCVGMVFALPLACGLMCLDNLVDTGFFTQNTSKTNSMSSPEVLAPRGTATEPSSSCNNNKTRPKARTAVNHDRKKRNQQKSERRRRSKNDDNRDDDENDAASIRDANCELFPTSIELPANKILAPCW